MTLLHPLRPGGLPTWESCATSTCICPAENALSPRLSALETGSEVKSSPKMRLRTQLYILQQAEATHSRLTAGHKQRAGSTCSQLKSVC